MWAILRVLLDKLLGAPCPLFPPHPLPKTIVMIQKNLSTNLTKSIFLCPVFIDMKKISLRNQNCLFYVLIFCPLNHLLELDNYPLCSPSKTDCYGRHCLHMSCTWFFLHEFIITAVMWRVHDFCLLERSREYTPQPYQIDI